jgi:thiol:disulfide interchange protein
MTLVAPLTPVTPGFIWLAASAGAVSLLTPCVFPMIPITVSYFTSRAERERPAALRSALVFALGIIATFTALGLALAVFVGATGASAFAANPWVNLGLAALFVAFALNLFGVWQVAVPSGVLTALDARVGRSGGPVLMGLLFTLTSFTCTAPFVGTVLVSAAAGQWQMPVIGMLAYSTVFATPFFVLALVPRWISRLPRSGSWLSTVKIVMGLVELAAAFKFLSNVDLVWHWGVVTRPVVLGSWIALAAITVVVLRFKPVSLVPAAIGVWLALGLAGKTRLGELEAFLPPAATPELAWRLNDLPGALAAAQHDGKPVFIDFTGYTCTNCRWMEANIFSRPEVVTALGRYELARLFTDGDGPAYEAQQAYQESHYNTVALPLYALVAPDGHTIATFAGLTRDPAAFVAFLRQTQ